jgi:hypothetical protein
MSKLGSWPVESTVRSVGRVAWPVLMAGLLAACSSHLAEEGTNEPWYNKTMVELVGGSRASGEYPAAPTLAVVRGNDPAHAASESPPDDLYRADGSCSGVPLVGPAGSSPQAAELSLEMTECDAVKQMGPPDKVELLRAEPASERNLVLTYRKGVRSGIYRFVAGRLVGIERIPEPPAASPKASVKRRAV